MHPGNAPGGPVDFFSKTFGVQLWVGNHARVSPEKGVTRHAASEPTREYWTTAVVVVLAAGD